MTTFPLRPLLVLFCLALLATPALADPPGRVGRISLADGVVSLHRGDSPQWMPAAVNYPVIGGDAVWVDRDGRAEVEIGGAEIRLDAATLLTFQRLDDQATEVRVDQGVANITVRFPPAGGLQIDTTVGQLDIRQPGEYHIDAGRPNGPPTQLVMGVISGEARFTGSRGVVELHGGQGAMVPPDQSLLTVVAVVPTPFDQWAEDRAMSLQVAQSSRYVSVEMTGFQDLDLYGTWQTVPDYGMVWFPTRIDVGWAPYRQGHWAFVQPWGWTWIDDAPWGFAPFHYGRWALCDGRWAWIPGERRERPFYAPALVAFIGGGPGAGVGVSWIPLGPREVFHPYYAVSDGYLRAVNRPHVTNVAQINATVTVNNFANQRAVTAVSANSFTGGAPVHQNLVTAAPAKAGGAPPAMLTNLNHLPPAALPTAPQPAGGQRLPAPPAAAMPQPRPAAPVVPPPATPQAMPQRPAAPILPPPAAEPRPMVMPQAMPQMPAQQPRPAPVAPAARPAEKEKDRDKH